MHVILLLIIVLLIIFFSSKYKKTHSISNQSINELDTNSNSYTSATYSNKLYGNISILILVVLLLGYGYYIFINEVPIRTSYELQDIEDKVAADQVRQYEIAKRQGNKMMMYTQASLVATAYLQAKDEANYKKWMDIADAAGQACGIPRGYR